MLRLTRKGYIFLVVGPLFVLAVGFAAAWLAGEGARLAGLKSEAIDAIALIACLVAMAITYTMLVRLIRLAARIAHEEIHKTFD